MVQVGRFGGPDELEVVDAPLPTTGRGEVRVRVLASSVQYTDVLSRRHAKSHSRSTSEGER
jgi:NADPH2:quinone reductase